ncbi:MAG TPA: non-ribosomal peptide synthetase, partial [Kofleriaceae bacterium]|nr:non-ribosomal peptide synthetase [Kofleriaceae bacterium]
MTLTWRQLASLLAAAAADWRRLGIGPGDIVVTSLSTVVPATPAVFLAVAAASACIPLNSDYRVRECVEHMKGDRTRALVVFGAEETDAVEAARSLGLVVIRLSPGAIMSGRWVAQTDGDAPPAAEAQGAAPAPGPDDVALVLHTSGTTARPKVVPLTQGNLVASARQIAAWLKLAPGDRCLNLMPLFHIHGLVGALLSSVTAGATLVTTPALEPAAFGRWLVDSEATWYTAVPTMHQVIVAALRGTDLPRPIRLRFVRSSSSPMPPPVAAELEALFGVPVLQAYGMTEASHQIACNPLPPGRTRAGSVGLPTGTEIRIVGEGGRVLARGQRGEVCIAGRGLFGGYADNPEANRASFLDGFFRTGDEGYLDEDGYLFLTGRLKEMINRGGEKIAPAEVDMVLLEHPSVAQAVCFAVPHPTLGEDIAAAVVARPGAEIDGAALQDFVADRVAPHKIPQRIAVLAALPKGPTGKLVRREVAAQLAGPGCGPSGAPASPPGPPTADEREALLQKVWCEVLDLDAISADDDYFTLGGDSLRAVTIIGKARTIGVELTMMDLMRHRSIRRICE